MSDRPLALITGAASGLGLETTRGLLAAGCDVVLADINLSGGQDATERLATACPDRNVAFRQLDLSDFNAISDFVTAWHAEQPRLDILINNAGLYPRHNRTATRQGIELGFGVGFYGHFALTAGLLPSLLAAPAARVVCVSSIAHSAGHIDLDDPKLERNYDSVRAYSAAKLASLLFASELDRRAREHGAPLKALAAHPGIARTTIGQYPDNPARKLRERMVGWSTRFAMRFLGQDADAGALPMIHAATAEGLQGGEFIGPGGAFQFRGPPRVVKASAKALARQDAAAVWRMAEQQTGLSFDWTPSS